MPGPLSKSYKYYFDRNNSVQEDMFKITLIEGIIYLDKPDVNMSTTQITLHVIAQNETSQPISLAEITITILATNDSILHPDSGYSYIVVRLLILC